jgi:hypothetical protein
MEGADLSNTIWRRSSRSGANGGECVEVAGLWRKASRSEPNGGECVELNGCRCGIAVRDSKDPEGPRLTMRTAAWREFTREIKAGRYDLP